MAHAMRAIGRLRAVRSSGALSISPSAIRAFSLAAHNRASHPAFTSPASSTPLRPGTRLLQHKLNSQPQARSFSLINAFDTAIYNAQEYLLFLHTSLNIPWYLTIPLFAISLNMVLRLPTRLYVQSMFHRQAKLRHLSEIFAVQEVQRQTAQQKGKASKMDHLLQKLPVLHTKANNKFRKRWKLQPWRIIAAQLATFPMWLLGIEAIRWQSTATGGLLGSILNWFREKPVTAKAADPVELANSAIKPTLPPPPLDNSLTEAISSSAQDIATTTATTTTTTTQPAMEGILWIPDFALSDPYHILPLTLSAVLVANAIPKDKTKLARMFGKAPVVNPDEKLTGKEEFRRRLMLTGARLNFWFSVLVGPLTIGLPAAMHLYWITSSLGNWMAKRLFDLVWPVEKPKELMRMRLEPYFIYPMPVEKKKPVVEVVKTAETTTRPPVVTSKRAATAATVVKNDAEVPPQTKPAPAKPVSRFSAVRGVKKEKKGE
ncbi:Putative protein of unknown function [Podospora comata]|uniref:Mitochondrial inner membrane protein OXA1 n=1 Tax=Podospora comata TaxID=48703 RepID=A0ABY6S7C8_PODCO|nr:Putative protein of unknown function [Podospora comata]